jgi:ERCC4-type nuclease
MLLIDHREEDAELIQTSLLCQGFACETLQLAVGDFLWVARHK